MPNYSYSDAPMAPNVDTLSRGYNPRNQPLVPLSAIPTASPASAPGPAQPVQNNNIARPLGNPMGNIWGLLGNLFGGGSAPQGPAQGMSGLLQTPVGRGAPGTNTLGNPYGRF